MDSTLFSVLMAVAGLVAGFGLSRVLMPGRGAAPAPEARPDTQGELAQAKGRIRQLEDERQLAVKNYEDLKHQTARERDVANSMKKEAAPLAERDAAQVASLQAQVAALQAQEQALRADAAKAQSAAQAEQAQARDYFQSLEKNQQLVADKAQALQREADTLRGALAKAEQENAALKRSSGAAAPAAAAPAQPTQLPVLEEQVLALQNLEKSIKKEFQLLAELQRNVTLTAATRHEFNDSPESKAGSSAAA